MSQQSVPPASPPTEPPWDPLDPRARRRRCIPALLCCACPNSHLRILMGQCGNFACQYATPYLQGVQGAGLSAAPAPGCPADTHLHTSRSRARQRRPPQAAAQACTSSLAQLTVPACAARRPCACPRTTASAAPAGCHPHPARSRAAHTPAVTAPPAPCRLKAWAGCVGRSAVVWRHPPAAS